MWPFWQKFAKSLEKNIWMFERNYIRVSQVKPETLTLLEHLVSLLFFTGASCKSPFVRIFTYIFFNFVFGLWFCGLIVFNGRSCFPSTNHTRWCTWSPWQVFGRGFSLHYTPRYNVYWSQTLYNNISRSRLMTSPAQTTGIQIKCPPHPIFANPVYRALQNSPFPRCPCRSNKRLVINYDIQLLHKSSFYNMDSILKTQEILKNIYRSTLERFLAW